MPSQHTYYHTEQERLRAEWDQLIKKLADICPNITDLVEEQKKVNSFLCLIMDLDDNNIDINEQMNRAKGFIFETSDIICYKDDMKDLVDDLEKILQDRILDGSLQPPDSEKPDLGENERGSHFREESAKMGHHNLR